MATLEDQIRMLLESKKSKAAKSTEQADRVDDEPAVKIENPMDPNLTSSELTPGQEESEEAEGTAGGDANERELAAKRKAENMRESIIESKKVYSNNIDNPLGTAAERKEHNKRMKDMFNVQVNYPSGGGELNYYGTPENVKDAVLYHYNYEEDEAKAEHPHLFEDAQQNYTVDIDHMGGNDVAAKKYNITLKKTNKTSHSYDATGSKENLKKYLAYHYDSTQDAKAIHPELFEDAQQNFDAALAQAEKTDLDPDNKDGNAAQLAAVQAVQNEDELDQSNADAEERFEDAKEKAALTESKKVYSNNIDNPLGTAAERKEHNKRMKDMFNVQVNYPSGGGELNYYGTPENVKDAVLYHYNYEEDEAKAEHPHLFEDTKESKISSKQLEEMLGSEFSDDFKLKAKTLFEATVKAQVSAHKQAIENAAAESVKKIEEEYAVKTDALTKEFQEKFDQRVKELEEETSEKIDGYLTYVAEEWTTKNELALEAGIKTELTESFITKLKDLCEQHYIDMPESKVDLYQQVVGQKAELEESLLTASTQLAALKEELNKVKRENIIEESTKDFSSLDASRFKTLVEDFEFEDEETFKKKLGIVKKSFFESKQTNAKEQLTEDLSKSKVIDEKGPSTIETITENTRMSAYLSALKQ